MGLRDRAVNALRAVFGAEREDRAAAESPSTAAAASQPASIFSTFGREEVSGMLSVSQSLIDRFADYEAMEEYPDIGCLAGDTKILLIEGSVVTTTTIEELAKESSGREIIGFDVKAKKMVKVTGAHPRLTALDAETVLLDFGQHKIRCTPDHKILTTDGYFEAKDLHKGTLAIGMWAGFNQNAEATISASLRFGTHELLADPTPAGRTKVFDITTETHNFVANGIVVHNSSFRYYAGDATQPNIQDSRTVWAQSDDRAIQDICDDLLKKKLKVEDDAWSQAYSLGMMGNEYSELLVTEDGVVGLNHLPAPTMRRVEAIDGGLIGYVQDVTGQFTANSHELRTMLAGNVEVPPNLALFEDWQVVHMRLRGTRRRSPYGVGVGEPARWIWKRLIILEDIAVIYRLNRIPRYVYRVDVTDVPPDRVESHLRKMKRDLRKKKYVNPKTGRFDMRYGAFAQDEDIFVAVRDGKELAGVDILSAPDWNTVEDLDYFKRMLHGTLNVPRAWLGQDEPIQGKGILCLTGDTKVPLLDGRTRTMAELAAEFGPGEEFFVHSIGADGSIVPGRAHSPQMTKPNAEIWEVTLDNNETVRGTPDHPFMLRDGTYRRLDELKTGDSLMPLYRRDSVESQDRLDGYDMVLDPLAEEWKFTHRIVAEQKWAGRSLRNEGRVVHHTDFDKKNNDPRNLSDPLRDEHLAIHRAHADKTLRRPDVVQKAIDASRWWTGSEENKQQCRENFAKARAPGGAQHAWCKSDEHRRLKSGQMQAQWEDDNSPLLARTQTEEFANASSKTMKESHRTGKLQVSGADNVRFRHDASFERLVEIATSYRCTGMKALVKWSGYSSCLVYRLVREAGLTYADFAGRYLVGGFKPSKTPSTNHKVVSVRSVGRADCYDFVVDDVHNYAISAGVFVHNSNEDVRAARTTLNLQREMRNGYERMCRVHLAARGLKDPWKPDLNILMTVPSGIWELVAYETLNARADYAARVVPYMSIQWIQENVLKLDEETRKKIKAERKEELQDGNPFATSLGMPPPMQMDPNQPQGDPNQQGGPNPQNQQQQGAAEDDEPPFKLKTASDWKTWDQQRRLEEWRHQQSRQNHQEIIDKLGKLMERQDDTFVARERDRQDFFKSVKDVALQVRAGRTVPVPSARNRPHYRNGRTSV